MERRYWGMIVACVIALFGVVYAAYETGVTVSDAPDESGQTKISAVTPREDGGAAGQGASSAGGGGQGSLATAIEGAIQTLETGSAQRPSGQDGAPAAAAPAAVESADGVNVAALREIGAAAPSIAPAPSPAKPGGAPVFDTVRVEPDGSAVLAGRAAPGAIVEVAVDGQPVETVRADGRGEFVALIEAPASPDGGGVRRIDLSSRLDDGAPRVAAAAPVIIAAPPAPRGQEAGREAGQEAAQERPVALRPGPLGVELLQKPGAVRAAGASIDQVSYGEQGAVRVAGRGEPGQTARVYLDNSLEAEARVSDKGEWNVELSREIAPALYTLRVDVHAQGGDVIGRAETPFERADDDEIRLQKGAVIVQPGNNLWKIADHVYGDGQRYTLIYQSNQDQIRDPDLIYPGQVLALPDEQGPAGGSGD